MSYNISDKIGNNRQVLNPSLLNDIWYSHQQIMSYNALFHLLIGGRGTGKTFDFKDWCLRKPNQSVWIRRIAEDLEKFEQTFFTDLIATGKVTDEDDYKIKKDILYFNGEPKINFLPLSVGRRFKSSSFHDVGDMIFDEFIDETNTYPKNELDKFMSIYETVNRLRVDGRPEVRVFFIGNKVNFQNPYFDFWKIRPFKGRFKRYCDGTVIVENYSNAKFEELKKATRSFKALSGSSYIRAMVENTSWLDSDAFIVKRPPESTIYCNIRYHETTFGLWKTKDKPGYYCSRAYNPELITFAPIFSCDDNELPLKTKSSAFEILSLAHEKSILFFDDPGLKDIVITLLQGGYKE